MRRFLETFALVVGWLAGSGMAWAQGMAAGHGWAHPHPGVHGGWHAPGPFPANPGTHIILRPPGAFLHGRPHRGVASFGFGVFPGQGVVGTDPGFAERLGNNVGLHALPPVAMPPGVGNINHPGMQPMPMTPQPLPTGSPFPIPNINFPGGTPGMQAPPQHDFGNHFPGHGHRPFVGFGPIIYTVPYYIPVYTQVIPTTPTPPAEEPYKGPYGLPEPPSAQPPPQPQQPPAAPPAAKPVTLLAFKDHTVVVVTDYWLEGDMLVYETSPGVRVRMPLDRLDLVLTQQLNRERNVRFVLEARP